MRTSQRRFNWVVGFWFVVAIVVLYAPESHADRYDDITQSNDMNNQTAGDIIGGDTIVGGASHRAIAVGGVSLGDVDIAQCLASTQWSLLIAAKQKVILNMWCAAEVYDIKGMYPNAAKARCGIKDIRGWYTSDTSCIIGETWAGPPPPPEPPSGGADTTEPVDQAEVIQYTETIIQQFEDYKVQITDLEASVEHLAGIPAQFIMSPEIQAQINADAQRREMAAKILQGEDPDE